MARGDACVSVEAHFLFLPEDVPGPAFRGISIHATDAMPAPDERLEFMKRTDRSHAAAAAGTLHSGMTMPDHQGGDRADVWYPLPALVPRQPSEPYPSLPLRHEP